ncbi:MAG: Cyclic nucleotide-gated potassium channel [Betaproteobacteria bacterium ADurb.Bin341]|nr:MAG: Cyclic nucleotide-gated potassium channel [Betaproteobacteria bacterium ADurb.Bin341]
MWLNDSFSRPDLQALLTKLIENVPVFSGFTETELLELLNGAEKRIFEAGKRIISEGNNGNFMYVVIDGQAKVVKQGDSYKKHELGVFGRGDCFGEMALIDHAPRSASIEALTDCILIRIRESDCWKNSAVGAKIFRNIAGILAQRLRDLHAVVLSNGKT